jgi:hypothetical protein
MHYNSYYLLLFNKTSGKRILHVIQQRKVQENETTLGFNSQLYFEPFL